MKIAMIGTGYVGFVSGVCFSNFGHDVVCADKAPDKIAKLERGEVAIYEPGLDALMEKNVAVGRLFFTTDLARAVVGVQTERTGAVIEPMRVSGRVVIIKG